MPLRRASKGENETLRSGPRRAHDEKRVSARAKPARVRFPLGLAQERLQHFPPLGSHRQLRLTDCYSCLRRELDQTIGALRHP